jgi:hypothetical protein
MTREWYFVRKLHPHEQPASGARFEVQILDDDGRAIAVGYLTADATKLLIDGRSVPQPVLEAAKQRTEGQGEYVGPNGQGLPPF